MTENTIKQSLTNFVDRVTPISKKQFKEFMKNDEIQKNNRFVSNRLEQLYIGQLHSNRAIRYLYKLFIGLCVIVLFTDSGMSNIFQQLLFKIIAHIKSLFNRS